MKLYLHILAIFTLLLHSCAKEPLTDRDRNDNITTIKFKANSLIDGELEGGSIQKVRFILFYNNKLYASYSTSNGTLQIDENGLFGISIAPDNNYSFAAIVNETPEMTQQLNALRYYSDLVAIDYDWQKYPLTAQNIPMINAGYLRVTMRGKVAEGSIYAVYTKDGRYYHDSSLGAEPWTTPSSTISIDMVRALPQVSLYLRKGDGVAPQININSVRIANLSSKAYVLDQYHNDVPVCTKSLFSGEAQTITSDGGSVSYNAKKYASFSSAIVSEKSFYDTHSEEDNNYAKSNPVNGAFLMINATFDGIPTTYKIPIGEGSADFRLVRNTNYNVYATISNIGEQGIYAVIEPVQMYNIAINWKPIEGLVIVSEKESDFDYVTGKFKNVNLWNDYNTYFGTLKVYHSATGYRDVVFKYGSLFAAYSDADASSDMPFVAPADVNTLNDILWYPSKYGNPHTQGIADWEGIPYVASGDIPTDNSQIANGIGDPCKLVGLTPEQIKDEGIKDNLQWRMATSADYAILMNVANNESNVYGYKAFHEVILQNVKSRNILGVLSASAGGEGNYWTTLSQNAFSFSSTNPTRASLVAKNPSQGFTIRCVRNQIPVGELFGGNTGFSYQGNITVGSSINITSNIPYWTAELIEDENDSFYGGNNEFNDFSFAPGETSVRSTSGKYSQSIRVYVKRKESRTLRKFNIRVSGIGFAGNRETAIVTVNQSGYNLRGTMSFLPSIGNIPKLGATYSVSVSLTPIDIALPVGVGMHIKASYHGDEIARSNIITTTGSTTYEYDGFEITIPANTTPDVIGIDFNLYWDGTTSIGSAYSHQSNK